MTNHSPEKRGEHNRTERLRLPGFYAGPGPDRPPLGSWPQPPRPHERGRWRRRRSAATTGVLIAGGAAVTGYLAYTVVAATPAPSSGGKASLTTGSHAQVTPAPAKPSIHVPIATSGGSGATGHHNDDGTGKDN